MISDFSGVQSTPVIIDGRAGLHLPLRPCPRCEMGDMPCTNRALERPWRKTAASAKRDRSSSTQLASIEWAWRKSLAFIGVPRQAKCMNAFPVAIAFAWPVFLQGLALSFGLIVAIGAQNAFVLRQGLRRGRCRADRGGCLRHGACIGRSASNGKGLGLGWRLVPVLVWLEGAVAGPTRGSPAGAPRHTGLQECPARSMLCGLRQLEDRHRVHQLLCL